MKPGGAFIADYIDRSSQADYASVHAEDWTLAIHGVTGEKVAS